MSKDSLKASDTERPDLDNAVRECDVKAVEAINAGNAVELAAALRDSGGNLSAAVLDLLCAVLDGSHKGAFHLAFKRRPGKPVDNTNQLLDQIFGLGAEVAAEYRQLGARRGYLKRAIGAVADRRHVSERTAAAAYAQHKAWTGNRQP